MFLKLDFFPFLGDTSSARITYIITNTFHKYVSQTVLERCKTNSEKNSRRYQVQWMSWATILYSRKSISCTEKMFLNAISHFSSSGSCVSNKIHLRFFPKNSISFTMGILKGQQPANRGTEVTPSVCVVNPHLHIHMEVTAQIVPDEVS